MNVEDIIAGLKMSDHQGIVQLDAQIYVQILNSLTMLPAAQKDALVAALLATAGEARPAAGGS